MLLITKIFGLSLLITGSVALDGAHQQIIHWFKSLNNTDLISCDKRSKFTFKEENVLTDSVKCVNDVPGKSISLFILFFIFHPLLQLY